MDCRQNWTCEDTPCQTAYATAIKDPVNLCDVTLDLLPRTDEAQFRCVLAGHHYLGDLPRIGETLWYVATMARHVGGADHEQMLVRSLVANARARLTRPVLDPIDCHGAPKIVPITCVRCRICSPTSPIHADRNLDGIACPAWSVIKPSANGSPI